MTDVIFTQAEWDIIKAALDEAYATRNYFLWLSNTSLRITRDHIELPKLRAVLETLNMVDIEHVRTVTTIDIPPSTYIGDEIQIAELVPMPAGAIKIGHDPLGHYESLSDEQMQRIRAEQHEAITDKVIKKNATSKRRRTRTASR